MTTPTLAPTVTVAEAARILRLHEKTIYRAIRCGDLPSVRVGRRVLIPTRRLVDMLDGSETVRAA